MNIQRNTWHARLYRTTYIFGTPPDKTNLCQYCQRLVFGTAWYLGFIVPALCCIIVLSYLIGHPVRMLAGRPPTWKLWEINPLDDKCGYIPYRYVAPWHVLLVVAISAFMWWLHHIHVLRVTETLDWVIGLTAVSAVLYASATSGLLGLLYEYLKAKKQGACPLVEFTNPEE